MDTMVSAIIHLANRDYANLVDDFINLKVLPEDCDRPKVIPLMDKALTPYVKGGGAQKYEEELRKIYGLDGTMSGSAGLVFLNIYIYIIFIVILKEIIIAVSNKITNDNDNYYNYDRKSNEQIIIIINK
jgi:hypothetical protein